MKKLWTICWLCMAGAALFPQPGRAYEILFHELYEDTMEMYAISDTEATLRNIGQGIYPAKSANKHYLAYIQLFKMRNGGFSPANPGRIAIRDLKENKPVKYISNGRIEFIPCFRWRPDGKSLAYISLAGPGLREGCIYIYNPADETSRKVLTFGYESFDSGFGGTDLEWSPDGKDLLFTALDRNNPGGIMKLIHAAEGSATVWTESGRRPRFVDDRRILYIAGKEIMTIGRDGGGKKQLMDIGSSIITVSQVAGGRAVVMTKKAAGGSEIPYTLYLLDISKKRAKEIGGDEPAFLCPVISPDGKKMTALGVKLGPERPEIGYYVYDFKTREHSCLKMLEKELSRGFWWSVYSGGGNSTSWN